MPMKIGYNPTNNNILIITPSMADTTPTQWVFDDSLIRRAVEPWIWRDVATFSPNLISKGVPRGCRFFHFATDVNNLFSFQVQGSFETYRPLYSNQQDVLPVRFIAYTSSFKGAIPFFTWETLDFLGFRKTSGLLDPSCLADVYAVVDSPYRHTVMYFMTPYTDKEEIEWMVSDECICLPTTHQDTTNRYNTLDSCLVDAIANVKNKYVWVENSGKSLFEYVQWWNSLPLADKQRSLIPRGNISEQSPTSSRTNPIIIYASILLAIVFIISLVLSRIQKKKNYNRKEI